MSLCRAVPVLVWSCATPTRAVHARVGLSGCTQGCARLWGCASPGVVVLVSVGLYMLMWGYLHPGEA